MMKELLISLRPKQWVKNLIVFAPLVFSKNLFESTNLCRALAAFALFCLLTGAVYLLNDLMDIENDRRHPLKRLRPLPSGRLAPGVAVVALALAAPGALAASFTLDTGFGLFAALYVANNLAYSTFIKHVVILDVMSIAAGFVLRVLAGAAAISVPATPWLLMCTILLALFLGFAKRRHEIGLLENEAQGHRRVLEHYSPYLLDQLILIVASATVMSYALYTLWPDTCAHFGTNKLLYTVPFVLYGLFRYLYLIHKRDEGGNPTQVLLTDKPLILDIILWFITCVAIVEGVFT